MKWPIPDDLPSPHLDSQFPELDSLVASPEERHLPPGPAQPYSLQAELALIARLITDPSHVPSVAARLSPDDFSDGMARAIYESMTDMQRKGLLIDGVTLAAYLNASGIAKKTGLINLEAIQELAIPAAKIDPYIALLQNFTVQRRYVALGQSIIDQARSHHPATRPWMTPCCRS